MANKKEYNGQVVQDEFNKLSLKDQLDVYNNLGEWLHDKILKHQESLAEENKHFDSARKTLKINSISK